MNTFYRHVEYLAQMLRDQGYSVSVTMDDNDEDPASVLIAGADITIHTMSAKRFLEVAHLYGGRAYQGLPIYYHPNSFNFLKGDKFRALLGNSFNWYVASGYYSHERSQAFMNHDKDDAHIMYRLVTKDKLAWRARAFLGVADEDVPTDVFAKWEEEAGFI